MKTSRWKRYDAASGLWIASSKPVFGYWFRFLKHAAEDRPNDVDWSAYEDWGDRDYILRTEQNEWWKTKWKTLFGYKEGETDPLYELSKAPSGKTTKPQPDGIRLALMVYELRDKSLLDGNDLTDEENEGDGKVGDTWEIAKWIAKQEYPKRKARAKKEPSYKPEDWTFDAVADDWVFHTARKAIARKLSKEDPAQFIKQKRTLQSRVGRYMRAAENHLDNVCKGQFP
jgi:hypothetical protein